MSTGSGAEVTDDPDKSSLCGMGEAKQQNLDSEKMGGEDLETASNNSFVMCRIGKQGNGR